MQRFYIPWQINSTFGLSRYVIFKFLFLLIDNLRLLLLLIILLSIIIKLNVVTMKTLLQITLLSLYTLYFVMFNKNMPVHWSRHYTIIILCSHVHKQRHLANRFLLPIFRAHSGCINLRERVIFSDKCAPNEHGHHEYLVMILFETSGRRSMSLISDVENFSGLYFLNLRNYRL